MANSLSARLVIVEVHRPDISTVQTFRVDLSKYGCAATTCESDLQLLIRGLCDKRPNFSTLFRSPDCSYALKFDDHLLEIGMKSPLDNVPLVVCTLPPHTSTDSADSLRSNNLAAVTIPLQSNETGTNVGSQSSTAAPADLVLTIEETAFFSDLSLDQSSAIVSTPSRNTHPVQPRNLNSSTGFSESSDTSMQTYRSRACIQSASNTRIEKRKLTTDKENTAQTFDIEIFKLPFFGTAITDKLKNKELLSVNEESKICRYIKDRVEEQTLAFKMSDARQVASLIIDCHQYLIFKNDRAATVAAWTKKIFDCVGRVRKREGKQISKTGRPKKKMKVSLGPSVKKSITHKNAAEDIATYTEHVNKMIEIYDKSTNAEALLTLWQLTFEVRRNIFTTAGRLPADISVREMISKHCPALFQVHYLFKELNSILGATCCQTFRRKWTNIVPKIVKIGLEKKKSKNIAAVFKEFPKESEESLALGLLPVLIGSNDAKAKNQEKYVIQPVKVSDKLSDAIDEVTRPRPFIAMCGATCHVIVNGEKLNTIEESPGDALLTLMGIYYVFDLQYEPIVRPTLWFIQSFLLGRSDDQTERCHRARSLISQLRIHSHEREDEYSDMEEDL